jgi:hypothetical protein
MILLKGYLMLQQLVHIIVKVLHNQTNLTQIELHGFGLWGDYINKLKHKGVAF